METATYRQTQRKWIKIPWLILWVVTFLKPLKLCTVFPEWFITWLTAVKRAHFKGLTFKLLWATKTEFLLIKSLHYQADKWWEYNPWITIFDDDICRCPQYVKRLTPWILICIRIATFLKSRYLHHTDLHWHVRKRHRGGIVLSLSI